MGLEWGRRALSLGKRRIGAGWAALFAVALGGCPHPEDKYNAFVDRSPVLDASGITDGGGAGLLDISGTFLLAVATTVAPDRPLQFLVDTTLTMNGDGTATLNLTAQPLTVATRMPVGMVITAMPATVDSTGAFVLDFGTVTVQGAANPISGAEITANLSLIGRIVSTDRFCGGVTGQVTAPITIELAGSSFGAIRVPPNTVGSALPPPDVSCPVVVTPQDGGAPDAGPADGGSSDLLPADAATSDAAHAG